MKATEKSILDFIGGLNKSFVIPPFQRNYEWTPTQCKELFDDIIFALQNDRPHYLGNLVYYEGESDTSYREFILVDGQQRVTTILLLLCAIRDTALQDGADDLAEEISAGYLLNTTKISKYRIRLKQTSYDSDSFICVVEKPKSINDSNNVSKNYQYFLELIDEAKKENITLAEIFKTITNLQIVDVNLQIKDDLQAVQTVFEKINSTGTPLTPADLIRNYLLLSKSVDEQNRLYNEYWTKIEKTVGGENISRFARDYLVLKTFDDIKKREIYSAFKNHFSENTVSKEDILEEMLSYSKYFAWVKFENCPDEKVNRTLQEFNLLKTDDVYPLYIYLLAEFFEKEKKEKKDDKELLKILRLVADFLLRYRIVTPSSGGGSLRAVVHQLLEKLSAENILPVYEAIHYELSNSNSSSGRFPDDREFSESLKNSNDANWNYGRIVFSRLEEYETKNSPIEYSKVTIEHLMPQTFNKWWTENFGGKENAEVVQENYMNCIGNLTPLSQGYNSKISNKPWTEKIEHLKNVQFKITQEIAKNKFWTQKEIQKRNEDVAERACLAVTSPQKRNRPYQKNNLQEVEEGTFSANDISTKMEGAKITAVFLKGKEIKIASWRDYFDEVCKYCFSLDANLFRQIVYENKIHKATSSKNFPEKDPIITAEKEKVNTPIFIEGSEFFYEANLSSIRIRVYAKQLLDFFDATKDVQFSIG